MILGWNFVFVLLLIHKFDFFVQQKNKIREECKVAKSMAKHWQEEWKKIRDELEETETENKNLKSEVEQLTLQLRKANEKVLAQTNELAALHEMQKECVGRSTIEYKEVMQGQVEEVAKVNETWLESF